MTEDIHPTLAAFVRYCEVWRLDYDSLSEAQIIRMITNFYLDQLTSAVCAQRRPAVYAPPNLKG